MMASRFSLEYTSYLPPTLTQAIWGGEPGWVGREGGGRVGVEGDRGFEERRGTEGEGEGEREGGREERKKRD